MSSTTDKRLRDLEGRYPVPLRPPPWLHWTTHAELDLLEAMYQLAEDEDRELTPMDLLRQIEIEAVATRRMLAGEPPA